MRVKILASFPYAENGRDTVLLHPSDDPEHRVEIRDELCAGLAAEGFIDGREHDLPLLSEGRRTAIIDNILASGRAELSRLSDEELIRLGEHYERRAKEAADDEEEDDEAEAPGPDEPQPEPEGGATEPETGTAEEQPAQPEQTDTSETEVAAETIEGAEADEPLAGAGEAVQEPSTDAATGEVLEPVAEAAPEAAPKHKLTPAQEAALDRIPDDGKTKAGGAPKGGNRKKAAKA